LPIYADTYFTGKEKATMMSLMLLSPPLGVVLGFSLTASLPSWRWSFVFNSALMFLCALIISFIPSHYLNINVVIDLLQDEKMRRLNDVSIPEIGGTG
jgi:MFS family permease